MILTEPASRKKLCPLIVGDGHCVGEACMAWTWRQEPYEIVYDPDPIPEEAERNEAVAHADYDGRKAYHIPRKNRKGTCGMIDAAQIWHEEHPQGRLLKEV